MVKKELRLLVTRGRGGAGGEEEGGYRAAFSYGISKEALGMDGPAGGLELTLL